MVDITGGKLICPYTGIGYIEKAIDIYSRRGAEHAKKDE